MAHPITTSDLTRVNAVQRRHYPAFHPGTRLHEELTGAGLEALARAATRYDPTKGTTWGSYAWHAIRRGMQDELRNQDHLTRPHRAAVNAGTARDPGAPAPLDTTPHADTTPDPHDQYAAVDARLTIQAALHALTTKQHAAITLVDLGTHTQTQAAQQLECTPSNISQLRRHARQRMRAHLAA